MGGCKQLRAHNTGLFLPLPRQCSWPTWSCSTSCWPYCPEHPTFNNQSFLPQHPLNRLWSWPTWSCSTFCWPSPAPTFWDWTRTAARSCTGPCCARCGVGGCMRCGRRKQRLLWVRPHADTAGVCLSVSACVGDLFCTCSALLKQFRCSVAGSPSHSPSLALTQA